MNLSDPVSQIILWVGVWGSVIGVITVGELVIRKSSKEDK